jgi:hypothetical protein
MIRAKFADVLALGTPYVAYQSIRNGIPTLGYHCCIHNVLVARSHIDLLILIFLKLSARESLDRIVGHRYI